MRKAEKGWCDILDPKEAASLAGKGNLEDLAHASRIQAEITRAYSKHDQETLELYICAGLFNAGVIAGKRIERKKKQIKKEKAKELNQSLNGAKEKGQSLNLRIDGTILRQTVEANHDIFPTNSRKCCR